MKTFNFIFVFVLLTIFVQSFCDAWTWPSSWKSKKNDVSSNVYLKKPDECNCKAVTMNKIIDGVDAKNHYPWMISLHNWFSHTCGATIINRRQILTATHCVKNRYVRWLYVVSGTNDKTGGSTSSVYLSECHFDTVDKPGTEFAYQKDLIVCDLSDDLDFTNPYVGPACFETISRDYDELMATGWGGIKRSFSMYKQFYSGTTPRILQQAFFKYDKTIDECNDGLVCVVPEHGKESICHGDSGGPLHSAFSNPPQSGLAVVGVASFTDVQNINDGEGKLYCNKYSYYQRLTAYTAYIKKYVKDDDICWVDAIPSNDIEEIAS